MSDNPILKGNFNPKRQVVINENEEQNDSLEEFEKRALAKLGGSICFVRKKQFLWNPEQNAEDAKKNNN